MGILLYIGVFYLGAMFGFLAEVWLRKRVDYTGTIFITKDREKTVYLLELDDYPDEIRFRKEVVFKVDSTEFDAMSALEGDPNRN